MELPLLASVIAAVVILAVVYRCWPRRRLQYYRGAVVGSRGCSMTMIPGATFGRLTVGGTIYDGRHSLRIDNGVVYVDDKRIDDGVVYGTLAVSIVGDVTLINTTSGELRVTGNAGVITTESGDVSVNGNSESITSQSGDIKVGGDVHHGSVQSESGDIQIGGAAGEAVQSESGDITIGGAASGAVRSASGDITIGRH